MDRLNGNQIQHALAYGVMSRSSTRCMANEIALYRSTDLTPEEVAAMQDHIRDLTEMIQCQNCQFSFKRQIGKESATE